MLLQIPDVLTPDQVAEMRRVLDRADWGDGRSTAGYQAAKVKNNQQLTEDHPVSRKLGGTILDSLERNPLFMSGALPQRIFPPMFNCYREGKYFGTHVDTAIRPIKGTPYRIRTDLSATLFLSAPDEYDGGELVVEDTFGTHNVKLPAGHLILYPSSSLHSVQPVTRGARIGSFFWIQSMIRSDENRTLLFDLDNTIQRIARDMPEHASAVELTNIYHNLLRRWADV